MHSFLRLLAIASIASCTPVFAGNLVAKPRATLTLPYKTESLRASFSAGSSFPILHSAGNDVYFQINYDGVIKTVQWPISDGSANIADGELTFRKDIRKTFQRAFILLSPGEGYNVKERLEGGLMQIEIPSNGQTLLVKVREEWFELLLSASDGESGKRSTPEVDAPEALREKHRTKPNLVTPSTFVDAVCLIEGNNGSGTGFILWMDGNHYIITNQHVAFQNLKPTIRTINGETFNPLMVEAASDRDLVRILIAEEAKCFIGRRQPVMGEPVVALGNSQGAGRIIELRGRVNGLAQTEVEITSEIVSGNSGSPLVSLQDGAIVGVATYLEQIDEDSFYTRGTDFDKPRRVGVRIDDDIEWISADWRKAHRSNMAFQQQEAFATETALLMLVLWNAPFSPVELELSDTALSSWLKRRNATVAGLLEFLNEVRANPQRFTSETFMDDYFEKHYLEQVNHQLYLTRLIRTHQQRLSHLGLHPDSEYTRSERNRILGVYRQCDKLTELAQQNIRKELDKHQR